MTLERLAAEIDDDTLLVSVPHVSYRTGARIDVPAVAALAHERGALMMLDAYQTAGSLPLDVGALGVDLLATGALKYLLGSAGLAYMWCSPALVERVVPTATGWFAAADIGAMDARRYDPAPAARRFESGTPPVPSLYAGVAGLGLIAELGAGGDRAHVRGLTARLVDGVRELGGRVVTPSFHGALTCIAATDPEALVAALDGRRRHHVLARRPACASRCTPTTTRATSTRCSPAWRSTARCSTDSPRSRLLALRSSIRSAARSPTSTPAQRPWRSAFLALPASAAATTATPST